MPWKDFTVKKTLNKDMHFETGTLRYLFILAREDRAKETPLNNRNKLQQWNGEGSYPSIL
jgi:hypothetical protein